MFAVIFGLRPLIDKLVPKIYSAHSKAINILYFVFFLLFLFVYEYEIWKNFWILLTFKNDFMDLLINIWDWEFTHCDCLYMVLINRQMKFQISHPQSVSYFLSKLYFNQLMEYEQNKAKKKMNELRNILSSLMWFNLPGFVLTQQMCVTWINRNVWVVIESTLSKTMGFICLKECNFYIVLPLSIC